jgi:hypothetical protein
MFFSSVRPRNRNQTGREGAKKKNIYNKKKNFKSARASEKSGINDRRFLNIQKNCMRDREETNSSKLATQHRQARAQTRSGEGTEEKDDEDVEETEAAREGTVRAPAAPIARPRTPTRPAARR